MLYQLRNGKTIEMSIEQYLSMDDDTLSLCLAANMGSSCEDPFVISVLRYGTPKETQKLYDDYDDHDIENLQYLILEESFMEENIITLEDLGI